MRVFVSSTGEDLREYRKTVIDAVRRREWTSVAMEHFGSDPRENLRLSLQRLREADAVVVLVAHRYGTPVPLSAGGDGRHSYTWYEVVEAESLRKPVFGYVAPGNVRLELPRESDLLEDTTDADARKALLDRIDLLRELKDKVRTRSAPPFTSPQDLATGVLADVGRWEEEQASRPTDGSPVAVAKWQPCIASALQPALHFSGRERELDALRAWWADPASPDRVIALIAIGGTGKTAIAEQFVQHVKQEARAGGLAAGLFVWSFYETPEVDRFLDAACEYFGAAPSKEGDRGGAFERLKGALRAGPAHTFVLDGLERVQGDGEGHRTRGEITDPTLKQFVRLLASGDLGRTRVLVTTRIPMADLAPWRDRGYRAIELTDLLPDAARAVLRGWDVRGDDAKLDALALRVGRHALSLAVLGSLIGRLGGGDPAFADKLDLAVDEKANPESARLGRILLYYREHLDEAERQTMGWLSAFPRGLSMELLGVLSNADGELAGVLVHCGDARLLAVLERLRSLGLVFGYGAGGALRWSAHPFLRDHFKVLLGVPAERAHDVVREELAKGLERRPGTPTEDPTVLDRYEAWIEHARGAGKAQEAFELFNFALGGWNALGKSRGDYRRGKRVLDDFVESEGPSGLAPSLPPSERASMVGSWGLFREGLGDLEGAIRCHEHSAAIRSETEDPSYESLSWQNASDALLLRGRLLAAQAAANRAQELADRGRDQRERWSSAARRGAAFDRVGDVAAALDAFDQATLYNQRQLHSGSGVYEAELHQRLGNKAVAREQTLANLGECESARWGRLIVLCHDVLAWCDLPDDPASARTHLDSLRAWAMRTGEVEMVLRAHLVAAMIHLAESNPSAALAEADEGIVVADTHGYGLLAIDLRLAAARAHLARPDAGASLQRARQALDLATDPECGYAWGHADAAHLCGVAHLRLGEVEQARTRLTDALAVRERIRHPGAAETREELARLPPTGR